VLLLLHGKATASVLPTVDETSIQVHQQSVTALNAPNWQLQLASSC
jgi:hypothetical protein